jgi:hypothetical protein
MERGRMKAKGKFPAKMWYLVVLLKTMDTKTTIRIVIMPWMIA